MTSSERKKVVPEAHGPLIYIAPWGAIKRWRVPELMARSDFRFATQLHIALNSEGIDLSYSQVQRLATAAPGRLTVDVMFALCRLFHCDPNDLWEHLGQAPSETKTDRSAQKRARTAKIARARIS
jgi:DNA-binding Xre family transcriptional regulator